MCSELIIIMIIIVIVIIIIIIIIIKIIIIIIIIVITNLFKVFLHSRSTTLKIWHTNKKSKNV